MNAGRIERVAVHAKDHDVDFFGLLDGSANALEIPDRTDARVEVENGRAKRTAIVNVPAFLFRKDIPVAGGMAGGSADAGSGARK